MCCHEDGYGGQWWGDTPENGDQEYYGDFSYDDDWYDDDWYPDPSWRDKLSANIRFAVHLIRMRIDKHYAEHINDIPF